MAIAVVGTVVLIALGALSAWPGWLGLALVVASMAVLFRQARQARTGAAEFDRVLAERVAQRSTTARSRRSMVLPFLMRDRGVERIKNVRYADGAGRRHLLDVYRPRDADDGRAGHAPDPRRRVDDRHEGHTGPTAHEPARARRLGVRRRELPPQPPGPMARPPGRRQAGARVDPRAHRRARRRPDAGRRHRRIGRRAPRGDDGADAERSALPTGLRRHRHVGDRRDPDVRRVRPRRALRAVRHEHRWSASVAGWARSSWASRRPTTSTRTSTRHRSRTSPTTPSADPFLVVHGTIDNLVPVEQARRFVAALRDAGTDVTYVELAGAPHAFDVFHSAWEHASTTGIEWWLSSVVPVTAVGRTETSRSGTDGPAASDPTTMARTAPS